MRRGRVPPAAALVSRVLLAGGDGAGWRGNMGAQCQAWCFYRVRRSPGSDAEEGGVGTGWESGCMAILRALSLGSAVTDGTVCQGGCLPLSWMVTLLTSSSPVRSAEAYSLLKRYARAGAACTESCTQVNAATNGHDVAIPRYCSRRESGSGALWETSVLRVQTGGRVSAAPVFVVASFPATRRAASYAFALRRCWAAVAGEQQRAFGRTSTTCGSREEGRVVVAWHVVEGCRFCGAETDLGQDVDIAAVRWMVVMVASFVGAAVGSVLHLPVEGQWLGVRRRSFRDRPRRRGGRD